jgi:Sensors of blue-light using FAD
MPSGALHRTVYMSTAVGVLRAEELDRIYLRAKSANSRGGITGLMLFYEGVFLQVLEGPAAGVTSLMEKIRRDRRHANLVVLESGAVDTRSFDQSPMHFVAARNLSAGEKQAFSELRQAVAARPAGLPGGLGLSDFLAAFAAAKPA